MLKRRVKQVLALILAGTMMFGNLPATDLGIQVQAEEAVEAFYELSKTEGIIPALESSHAVAYGIKLAKELGKGKNIVVNLSGRGDKDLDFVLSLK